MARILAQGDHTAVSPFSLTLTVTAAQFAQVHYITSAISSGSPGVVGLPTDSRGGIWQDGTFGGSYPPVLGAIRNRNGLLGPGRRDMLLGESAVRVGGAPLQIGDTVSVPWDAGSPASMTIVGVLLDLPEVTGTGVGQYLGSTDNTFLGVYYANGDINEDDSDTVSWAFDVPGFSPLPGTTCKMLAACASYPANSGWTPISGTKIAEVHSADGQISLGVHLADAPGREQVEPGGSWQNVVPLLAANYQFIEAVRNPVFRHRFKAHA